MTDTQLLKRYQQDGDQQWMGILLERYTLLLLGVCMKYLKNEEEARDCVQQIYLKVLTDINKHQVTYFKSWLYMVAKNESLMRLRNRQNKQVKELQDEHHPHQPAQPNGELLEQETTLSLLEESIQELNEEQRLSVSLFYLQKMSYQQISDRTGFSLLQVKSYIQNGKRNLRLMLERKLKDRTT
ncbi:RNA polymerase sigma-70 factor, ECF subfamily [Cnuella takakiae]|uniref:RNA polymerase sigma-70 factor, ECF subfamily n=2 Tax=Cnuella takakiae TaxID=1302690 RepID=A0A1M5FY93_9BACT|nr:RNA polymerase subunit sigma-24 [Cnuella takakiae]SHF96374.1 RNA polymerase sigma-70 factor, ECF subfamily [Cnuella takakiae]